jgi:histidinol dehydrogenase
MVHTNPDWIAMDLFSQAEHDEDAQAILLCPDKDFISQKLKISISKASSFNGDEKQIIKIFFKK